MFIVVDFPAPLDLRSRRSGLFPREMTGDRQRCDHRISLLNLHFYHNLLPPLLVLFLLRKCDEVSKCLCFLCEMCVTLITRTLPDSRSSPRDRVCARFEGEVNSRTLRSLVSSPYGRVCARFEPVVSNSTRQVRAYRGEIAGFLGIGRYWHRLFPVGVFYVNS